MIFGRDSQFVGHLASAVTFNFGRAGDGERVSEKLRRGVGPSLALMGPMFAAVVIVSVSLGLVLASLRGSAWDKAGMGLCVAGMSVPYLSYILFGQYFLAYKWGLFPVYYSAEAGLGRCVALPILIGIAAGLGGHVRFYRTVMLEELGKDYVRTARAKGLGPSAVLFKHVLGNAMIVVVTRVVTAIPFLCLGSVLLERFFGISGLGYLMVEAIGARDFAVINAMTYMTALLVVAFNLVTDVCYGLMDPRVRVGKVG